MNKKESKHRIMNKIILTGRLAKEPIPKVSQNGIPVARTAIAVKEYKNSQTQFFNLVAFGPHANFINSYLHKGDYVMIEGRISLNTFINRNGDKVTMTSIIVDSITKPPRSNKDYQYYSPIQQNQADIITDEDVRAFDFSNNNADDNITDKDVMWTEDLGKEDEEQKKQQKQD